MHNKPVKGKFVVACLAFLLINIAFAIELKAQEESIRHLVQPMETFYSLSVKYKVTIDDIKKANPGLAMPRAGEYLNIPVKARKDEIIADIDCNKLKKSKNQVFKIALMIPLYLEQAADSGWAESIDPERVREIAPFRFIQFYHGVMIAADSMRQRGMHLKIYVYDVDQQLLKVHRALDDPEFKSMNLIIGPFMKNTFAEVAEYARQNGIPIINPLSPRQDIISGNPYVFKIVPSVEKQYLTVARLIERDFSDHNIIIYTANKFQGSTMVEILRQAVQEALQPGAPAVKVVDFAKDSTHGFYDYVSLTHRNLVIIYAENESLPAALLSKLSAVKDEYGITIIGIPEWDKFSNLESGYLVGLHAHLLMSSYIDYNLENVTGFIARYRADYYDEPQDFAFTGFEVGYYFFQALLNYGQDFRGCQDNLKFPMVQNQFYFEQSPDGGYENIYWNIIKYDEYRFVNRSVSWK